MADLLLDLVADVLGLVVADVLPDGSAHFGLLLMTLDFRLLGLHSGLGGDLLGLLAGNLVLDGSQDVSNLLHDGSLSTNDDWPSNSKHRSPNSNHWPSDNQRSSYS